MLLKLVTKSSVCIPITYQEMESVTNIFKYITYQEMESVTTTFKNITDQVLQSVLTRFNDKEMTDKVKMLVCFLL